MRKLPRFSRWSHAVLCLGLLTSLVAACSAILNHDKDQCNTDADCVAFGGHPTCQDHVCVASGLGPEGCFAGTPSTPEQFANQCSTAKCETFDNCARLGICAPDAALPATVNPPIPDASTAPPADAPDTSGLPPCVANARTIVVGGSTAVQPFMSVVAKILGAESQPYVIAYQPSGSCTGVDNMFNAAKQIVKDIPGKQAVVYNTDGVPTNCTFGAGATLDVAASDVFAPSCNAAYTATDTIGEYLGPIQPMTFVVPATSKETAMSAELGHIVFGRGSTDTKSAPYVDPALHFIRNSGSGTQQMISRAILVDAAHWWGVDKGNSTNVATNLKGVASPSDAAAIGILSTDFTDPARSQLRTLAFKATNQICGYYPDSSLFTRDKATVRDGHYNIWGPVHFFARISGGVPTEAGGALVTRFTLPRLDQPLLDAITDIGFVPPCAMTVKRTAEMGDISAFSPQFQCGCYFEARLAAGTAPAGCKTCSSAVDCTADKPACNSGYCELR